MLTHRGIADTLDYPSLLKIYRERGPYGRDDLMEGTELFVKYILQIEALCGSYEAKNYAELSQLLGLGSRPIIRHSQKAEIAQSLHDILVMRKTGKIGEVLDAVHGSGLLSKPREIREIERSIGSSNLDGRSQRDTEFAQKLRDISYQEVIAYMHFKNERTPFSTQHGVKGDEFDNVVVVIDDGVWNQYNMGKMLAGSDIESRRQRSRNLFYVCCSRARQRLAVVFLTDLPPEAKPVARDWFASGIVHP
ncbi:UvrD-like helicase C-terminal domain-containing protein [Thermomonospora echinospora]|uniref:UvrD-like helicase C-terminal domain-containing protein n=2 Tax=Thermomonospora echinospora TaxID=1992 RepID=A0A1H5YQ25_9ACTN|nr:UvrD-like helicase C-terminal domain-containing protein [Thermomonospora echinospora]